MTQAIPEIVYAEVSLHDAHKRVYLHRVIAFQLFITSSNEAESSRSIPAFTPFPLISFQFDSCLFFNVGTTH